MHQAHYRYQSVYRYYYYDIVIVMGQWQCDNDPWWKNRDKHPCKKQSYYRYRYHTFTSMTDVARFLKYVVEGWSEGIYHQRNLTAFYKIKMYNYPAKCIQHFLAIVSHWHIRELLLLIIVTIVWHRSTLGFLHANYGHKIPNNNVTIKTNGFLNQNLLIQELDELSLNRLTIVLIVWIELGSV